MAARKFTRRTFLMGSLALAAGCATTGRRAAKTLPPSETVRIAGIGVGGMGGGDIQGVAGIPGTKIVALCDVDYRQAAKTFDAFPDAKQYKDYRLMLDEMANEIDAVVISTPDHSHAPAALACMQLGKHVRVQKPLTWSVQEARQLAEAAREYRVVTQMGNQGHAHDGVRQMCEILWSDIIGPVREVHIWTNRPIWPQGMPNPLPEAPVPEEIDWDLWIGPAPFRPYGMSPVRNVEFVPFRPADTDSNKPITYAPFAWRGWWDFGCGALGDMGCHIMDPANWALQLGAPTSVECVVQEGNTPQSPPIWSTIRYEFPERPFNEPYDVAWRGKTLPPVTVYWHDGYKADGSQNLPPRPEGVPANEQLGDGDNGSYFIGEKGMATTGTYGGNTRLMPAATAADIPLPDPVIPRVARLDGEGDGNVYLEWINGIKGGPMPGSNFEYSGPFTEMVNLGNVALRAGTKIEWDAKNMRVTNNEEANQYLGRENREGWRF